MRHSLEDLMVHYLGRNGPRSRVAGRKRARKPDPLYSQFQQAARVARNVIAAEDGGDFVATRYDVGNRKIRYEFKRRNRRSRTKI